MPAALEPRIGRVAFLMPRLHEIPLIVKPAPGMVPYAELKTSVIVS